MSSLAPPSAPATLHIDSRPTQTMGNVDMSNAMGWVSIACWMVVYSPQIIENYHLKSGEGLSVAFVLIWLLGDLCNLAGARMAHLQSTIIILAAYYTLCDITLLFQIYYYRYTRRARPMVSVPAVAVVNEAGEQTPLLHPPNGEADTKTGSKKPSDLKAATQYLLCLAFVVAAGMTAWSISRYYSVSEDPDAPAKKPKVVLEWKSQVIGWMSAVLYLGSRIPQIVKNTKTHCEGLSLALFMFCIVGNVTYVLSICTLSMEREHLIANASWLAGSGLTVFLDFTVLGQFFYYRASGPTLVMVSDAAA